MLPLSFFVQKQNNYLKEYGSFSFIIGLFCVASAVDRLAFGQGEDHLSIFDSYKKINRDNVLKCSCSRN